MTPSPTAHEVKGVAFFQLMTQGARPLDDVPILVALHGASSTPLRLVADYLDFPVRARLLFPRGWQALNQGYAWFTLPGIVNGQPSYVAADLHAATDRLIPWLQFMAQFTAHGPPLATGHSQGGIIAYDLAIRYPGLCQACVPYCSYYDATGLTTPGSPGSRIHVLHGGIDTLLAASLAEQTVAALRQLSYRATLQLIADCGHMPNEAMLQQVRQAQINLLPARVSTTAARVPYRQRHWRYSRH